MSQMWGKILQPAQGVGIAVFRFKDHRSPQFLHQAALPGDTEFGGEPGADMGDDIYGMYFRH